jgi:zinc transport system substrate-binding protein
MHLLLLAALAVAPLKVGVTLHPYFSWAANVTQGLPIDVVGVLPGEVDAGNYQPRPEDIARLKALDVLLVNGIGHDDFIEGMLKASGNERCTVVRLNAGTALLKNHRGEAMNSHTFLSFSNAIGQSYLIARSLAQLRPELASALQKNATAYATRLRQQRASALQRLSQARTRRVVTVHDGYSYLLQELELTLIDVVEPSHGLIPSVAELGQLLRRLEAEPVKVVLSEERFPSALVEVLKEHGATVVVVSHIATGTFAAERFEHEMQANVDALVSALQASSPNGPRSHTP